MVLMVIYVMISIVISWFQLSCYGSNKYLWYGFHGNVMVLIHLFRCKKKVCCNELLV